MRVETTRGPSPAPAEGLRGLVVALGLLACCASAPGGRSQEIRGMTVSTPGIGEDWGSDAMVDTLRELADLGVTWVAIHPYASIARDGTVRGFFGGRGAPEGPPRWLSRPIEEAHRLGLRIFVKPHLAYWGSGFAWRGEIAFETPEAWARFFAGYREWIAAVARFSRDADAFAVGTELDRTLEHEDAWREVIAAVRRAYSGPLTYAANWTDYRRVPFWDAVDAIGIQAYFPILDGVPGDEAPSERDLAIGWRRVMGEVSELSHRTGKHIVFTELGYNRSALAPFEPWDYAVGGRDAERAQLRCLRAALRAIAAEPRVVGAFLWKWFPGLREPRNFAMSAPGVRGLLAAEWGGSAPLNRGR